MELKIFESLGEAVQLRLVQLGDCIELQVVDSEGKRMCAGSLLQITSKGEVHLIEDCRVKGINTDSNGRIIVD